MFIVPTLNGLAGREHRLDFVIAGTVHPRMGTSRPAQVARAALFLASDLSTFMTRMILEATGGPPP